MPGDELWWDGFALPVTDGYVTTAVEFQGSLVIAGHFTRIGNVRANSIARWDGNAWTPLGQGINLGWVNSLAVHQGDLVAAGKFSFAGGVFVRSIARWNGAEWIPFGEGLHDPNANPREVLCVASRQDTLVASVDLSHEHYYGDPVPTPYSGLVDYWTGSDWVELGPGANGLVRSLAFHDGLLFAGGTFDSLGSVPAAGIAQWNGVSWSEVGGGLGSFSRSVDALMVHSGRLVAAGGFDSAGGAGASNIAAWDGAEWEAMGSLPTAVTALAAKGDTLFAGCVDSLVRWDGQSWVSAASIVGSPGSLVALGEDLFLAGSIEVTNPGEQVPTALSVARLSSGTWHSVMNVTNGMQGLTDTGGQAATIYSMVSYRDHVLAAGSFHFAGTPPTWTRLSGLAQWDGSRWEPFPGPPGLYPVYLLMVRSGTLYAAGTFGGSASPLYRYDGQDWTPMGDQAFFVNAMAFHNGTLYVAADAPPSWGSTQVLRWTGSSWETIGSGKSASYAYIDALVEYDGNLVVAGRFFSMNDVPAANAAVWDNTTWQQFGPGLPSPSYSPESIVRQLAVSNGHLLASGDHISGVVQWSGTDWSELGALTGKIDVLRDIGGQLFASRYFNLDRWNGSEWETLGSGTNGLVTAFATLGNSVYMGGWFSDAGGKPSYAVARWDGLRAAPAVPTLQAPRPNPFAASTAFSYELPRPGNVRLSIHDVSGREIAVIEQGPRSAGMHTVIWLGRDRSARRVPSGVYFLRAALPNGARETRKIVLLH